jgi:glutathione S-transferase
MKLYGGPLSPFFRKARVVLEEKGIPYEVERLAPVPKTPELLAMHPLGKIPILRDGDVVVPDSSVICAYLERLQPTPVFYPQEARELAAALFLEEYADTRMSEIIGGINFETYVKPQILKLDPDLARAAELRTRLPEVYDYVESRLSPDREWLLARFGIADVGVGAQLQGLTFCGEEIDASRWPRTSAYRSAVEARPSFKTAIS